MGLWIRSQDGQLLLQTKVLEIDYLGETYVSIRTRYDGKMWCSLGAYKSEERALEVLDEIHQRLIDLQTLEILPDFYKVTKRCLDNVYEMPKE